MLQWTIIKLYMHILGISGYLGIRKAFSLTGYLFAQGRELVQLAGDLKVPGSTPGWGKLQLREPTYE